MEYEWPGNLIYSPEKQTITWRREQMAKEMKMKKEVKKPKKAKHDDKAQDMAMLKSKVKKGCMK